MEEFIIFSDLDGTLLDHNTYSYDAANPALELVTLNKIPLILTSSKSLAEIEEIRRELGTKHPFIVENGGAICIPQGYFNLQKDQPVISNFEIEYLGPAYNDILQSVSEIRERTNFRFKGFNDMSQEEIIMLTELPHAKAAKAKNRLCSEPLVWEDTTENLQEFTEHLQKKGLKLLKGGRFYHLMGNTDKGKAVLHLLDLFKNKYPHSQFQTIGIGDSPNDIEMLKEVNIPVLVQRADGTYIDVPFEKKVIHADGMGPIGWNKAITEILAKN
jgi:mannosyl-3-phosphoglycerate phosphatase